MNRKFEHMIVEVPATAIGQQVQNMLQTMENDGFELVCVSPVQAFPQKAPLYRHYFKREVPPILQAPNIRDLVGQHDNNDE